MICTAFFIMVEGFSAYGRNVIIFRICRKNHSTNKGNILLKSGRINLLSQNVY